MKNYMAEPTYDLKGKFNSWGIQCDSRSPIATKEMQVYVPFSTKVRLSLRGLGLSRMVAVIVIKKAKEMTSIGTTKVC